MPWPLSRTEKRTKPSGAGAAPSVIVPPAGEYFEALEMRFMNTCRSRLASTSTSPSPRSSPASSCCPPPPPTLPPPRRDERAALVCDPAHKLAPRCPPAVERGCTRLKPREVQQRVQYPEQPVRVVPRRFKHLALGGRQGSQGLLEQ